MTARSYVRSELRLSSIILFVKRRLIIVCDPRSRGVMMYSSDLSYIRRRNRLPRTFRFDEIPHEKRRFLAAESVLSRPLHTAPSPPSNLNASGAGDMMPPDKEGKSWPILRNPTVPLVLGAGAASLQNRKVPPPEVPAATSKVPLLNNVTGDVLAAFGASAGVSPFITIVDRAIIQVNRA